MKCSSQASLIKRSAPSSRIWDGGDSRCPASNVTCGGVSGFGPRNVSVAVTVAGGPTGTTTPSISLSPTTIGKLQYTRGVAWIKLPVDRSTEIDEPARMTYEPAATAAN